MNNEQRVIKTVLIEGVGWPEMGRIPRRFRHDYVKPVRVFKSGRSKKKETDVKVEEQLKSDSQ